MDLQQETDDLLSQPPYSYEPGEHATKILNVLRELIRFGGERNSDYKRYLSSWPVPLDAAEVVSDLPYLPVSSFKISPPLSLIDTADVKSVVKSSATTGQSPSQIVLDSPTSRRMTKSLSIILQDYIGNGRRPYLVVDASQSNVVSESLGARTAAIRGLQPFARTTSYCLTLNENETLGLCEESLSDFCSAYQDQNVLVYGFTYILWKYLVKPLAEQGRSLNLPEAFVMHSGGWKRLLNEAVSKEEFKATASQVIGCPPESIIDFYGMVENVGIVYPDCEQNLKHVPGVGDVVIRNPLTFQPVDVGEVGLVQVCSSLPTSFPGGSLLTEDMARLKLLDGCGCGRRGAAFEFVGRVPKTEVRGCGNIKRS